MAHKLIVGVIALAIFALVARTVADDSAAPAHVRAASPEQAGRYLILASGCNDCHTPGWMQFGEKIPESQWLTGVPLGSRGPWGTTYASNLRLFIKPFSEDDFVKLAHTRNSRPPMPWPSLHAMSEADLRSVYRYIKSLPQVGEAMPEFVPPGQEPKTPYLSLMPQMPQANVAAATTQRIDGAQ